MPQNIGGWRFDLEDYEALQATSDPMPPTAFRAAAPVADPWTLIHQENQFSQGSCQGNALSTIVENNLRIAKGAGTQYPQLSRQYAYVETQRLDGLIGSDRGSTITGGVKLATTRGICEESLWPYTGKYHTKPPGATIEACYQNAQKYRIARTIETKSYDDVYTFLNNGFGGVTIGIRWGGECDTAVLNTYRGRSGGGHAIALLFISPRTDAQGRNYIWMNNSWGESWGNKGWAEWAPDAIDAMIGNGYTAIAGLTDMVDIHPRPIDHRGRLA